MKGGSVRAKNALLMWVPFLEAEDDSEIFDPTKPVLKYCKHVTAQEMERFWLDTFIGECYVSLIKAGVKKQHQVLEFNTAALAVFNWPATALSANGCAKTGRPSSKLAIASAGDAISISGSFVTGDQPDRPRFRTVAHT